MRKRVCFWMFALLFICATSVRSQVTIGSQNDPHAGALLDLQSTTKGLLLPKVALTDVSVLTVVDNPTAEQKAAAVGMVVYNTNASIVGGDDVGVYVWDGSKWMGSSGNNVKTVTIEGLTFMDRNLGASASADPFPASYNPGTNTSPSGVLNGGYFQWGRVADGHEKWDQTSVPGQVSSYDAAGQVLGSSPAFGHFITSQAAAADWRAVHDGNLWNGTDGGTGNPCPTGFRVPTEAEWTTVKSSLTWNSSVNGLTNGSNFFLPAVGSRHSVDALFYSVGSNGGYWTSTASSDVAVSFAFNNSLTVTGNDVRASGRTVRCIKRLQ